MTSTQIGQSSFLLWAMAALVSVLAAYLFVGWVRRAQGAYSLSELWGSALLASSVLGLGLSSSTVLALSAPAMAFPLGYRWWALPWLVLCPMAACLPAAWWLSRRQDWLALLGAGLLIGAVALAVQVGWVLAAGFRPGLRWQFGWLAAAGSLAVLGSTASLWLAYSEASSNGANRTLWRVGAAALMALTVMTSQEGVLLSTDLLFQVGSVYAREAGSTWLCLVAGALVPAALVALSLDLTLRLGSDRRGRRHGSYTEPSPAGRRKRRRRYRAL